MSKSTVLVLVLVIVVMTLSVTVFKGGNTRSAQVKITKTQPYADRSDRYPTTNEEEAEPADPAKKAKLKERQKRYNESAFTRPGPKDEELAFAPEAAFNFPALPVKESDVVVVGQVLGAAAHRSENKLNVFGDYEVRVDEVLKGALVPGTTITVERVGGFVNYGNGRKVLFRFVGHGAPAIGARYAFFLNTLDQDYSILTAYELGASGILPLDNSSQFRTYQGEGEISFLKSLRDAISK